MWFVEVYLRIALELSPPFALGQVKLEITVKTRGITFISDIGNGEAPLKKDANALWETAFGQYQDIFPLFYEVLKFCKNDES